MSKIRYRQVHLDFHTSEYIPDIAADFDKERICKNIGRSTCRFHYMFCKMSSWMAVLSVKKISGAHPPGIEEQKLFTGADRGVS